MPTFEVWFGRMEDNAGEPLFCVDIAPPEHNRSFPGKRNLNLDQLRQAIKSMGISEVDAIQIMNLAVHETSRIYTLALRDEVAAGFGWTKV